MKPDYCGLPWRAGELGCCTDYTDMQTVLPTRSSMRAYCKSVSHQQLATQSVPAANTYSVQAVRIALGAGRGSVLSDLDTYSQTQVCYSISTS